MILTQPIWLALVVPLALAAFVWRPRSRTLLALRLALYALILLALAEPVIRAVGSGGTVVLVVDRSESMPAGSDAAHLELYSTLRSTMGPDDQLAMVTFGAAARVETPAGRRDQPAFRVSIDPTASSLGQAIARAIATIPPGAAGRLLVVSDGSATDGTARRSASQAAGRGIPIDTIHLARPATNDLAIDRLEAPLRVAPGESFLVHADIAAPAPAQVRYELSRSGTTIAQGEADIPAGGGRLSFRDIGRPGATMDYSLTVVPSEPDAIAENNTARLLVGVRDVRPVLVVSTTPGAGLAALLRGSGLQIDARDPRAVDWSLASLAGYSAVVLKNVAIQDISLTGAESIAQLVTDRGTGLVMTGGRRSFGAGGYRNTPIERILPVSLELRNEMRKLAATIVVALDRSGSMAAPVGGGRTKMQLAGEGSAQVLEMLSSNDRFGAIAVDSAPSIVVPLRPGENTASDASRLRRLQAGGGGIYVYEALKAATRMLASDGARGTRHLVLFADAADAEQPDQSFALLSQSLDAGITASVVALGTPGDQDAALLRDIATAGGGRIFFTTDARLLPQLFTQDTLAVVRCAFLEDPVAVLPRGALRILLERDLGPWPALGGYNPTFAKPEASVAAVSGDEFAAPIVATWSAGSGRVAAYTGEVDGEHTGGFASWDQSGSLLAGLVRWASSEQTSTAVVRQRLEPGALRIDVYADADAVADRPTVRLLRDRRGSAAEPTPERHAMAFTATDQLTATIPVGASDTVVPTIEIDGMLVPLTPARLPYSPEFRPIQASSTSTTGKPLLERLAERTGGTERTTPSAIWDELPLAVRDVPLRPWLLIAAVLLLVLEVAHRRIGLALSVLARPAASVARRAQAGHTTAQTSAPSAKPKPQAAPKPAKPERSAPPAPDQGGVLGAIRDIRAPDRQDPD